MMARPAIATGVATTVAVLAAEAADDDGDGDAADDGAGDAPEVGRGVAVAEGVPFVAAGEDEPKPPTRNVRATNRASQMKYWKMPAMIDSMNRSDRVSLVMNFAIGAATSAAARTISGL